MGNNIDTWRKIYKEVPVPEDLSDIINHTFQEEQQKLRQKSSGRTILKRSGIGLLTAAAVFVLLINTIPSFALAAAEIPVVKNVVKVILLRDFHYEDHNYWADVKVPVLSQMKESDLASELNAKYLAEGRKLYEEFKKEMDQEQGKGHRSVTSNYELVTDTPQICVIKRETSMSQADSMTTVKYDTIDKENGVVITLPSLFKDDHYVQTITKEIKQQMKAQMAQDAEKVYFTEEADELKAIRKNQSFFISSQGELVISFDSFEVAPGFMGAVTFTIPTKVIQSDLVSNQFIK